MKCKLSEKCEFGNLCKDATRHDSLTVLGCSSFKTKKPLTNEEYIRTCSTEELAIFLCNELQDDEVGTLANRFERELYSEYPIRPMNAYHEVMRWLKEKHDD